MKKKLVLFILFFITLFFQVNDVKADSSFDTGDCIKNYGQITFSSVGGYTHLGGIVKFSNEVNNSKWNTDPVSFDVEIKATNKQRVKTIGYQIDSKDGYTCKGEISGSQIDANTGNVKLKVTIDKGYVSKMFFWGGSVSMTDPNKTDQIPSNKVNVRKNLTESEEEEMGIGKLETGEKLSCSSLEKLFDKYWRWLMILAPALTILLITTDFVKPIFTNDSKDSDALKKAGNDAVKRVIALVLLLMLPLIIGFIFNLFGIEFCSF